jgi:hypothetical protein
MRAFELEETAADELKRKLPSLNKTDYSTIDHLMKRISKRFNISGKKLHDLFVSKYGETPDHWIKKYKNKLDEAVLAGKPIYVIYVDGKPATKYVDSSEAKQDLQLLKNKFPNKTFVIKQQNDKPPGGNNLIGEANPELLSIPNPKKIYLVYGDNKPVVKFNNPKDAQTTMKSLRSKFPEIRYTIVVKDEHGKVFEGVESSDDEQKIKDFIEWSYKQVNLQKPYPQFTFSRNTEEAQEGHHTGRHTHDGENSQIWVYIENRNLIDIFRTIFHEIVHERQMQLNMIGPDDSYPGSPVEAMADMMAGKYIKIYGKEHPEIFQ